MKVKINKNIENEQQIKDIERRTKKIIEELDHIKQSNQILTSQIQEILNSSSYKLQIKT